MAGGFDNGIVGPRASAMGTAFAGLADDPSAIFYNPAGVALLDRRQGLSVTARYSTTDLKYRFPEGHTSPSGKTGGTSTLQGVLPDLFYYRRFFDRFSAGIGIYVPYGGLAGSWDRDVFGLEMDQFLAVASVTPSFAVAVTPRFAVGAGLNVYFGYMKSKTRGDRIPLGLFLPEAAASLPDLPVFDLIRYIPLRFEQDFHAKGFFLGYNVGALYRPTKWLSLGLSMRSATDAKLTGPADIVVYLRDPLALCLHSDLEVRFDLPYLVTGGIALRPARGLVLAGDVQYNGWGRTEEIRITFEELRFTQAVRTGYEDTVKFMLGAEYSLRSHWSLRFGYMYTPKNLEDISFLSYQSWDTDVHNFACGIGYAWTNLSVHLLAVISPGVWREKGFDDRADPVGRPAGQYTLFSQTYGAGCLWYF
jgi:long-chain fatty acid transport protein